MNEQKIFNNNVWFHGTKYNFKDFDLSKFGQTDDGWWGVGVYFHSDIETAKIYGNNIIQALLKTNKILNLPTEYSGKFLYDKLNELGLELPLEYKDYSAMKIIRNIGKEEFTNFIEKYFDVMIINYTQGTKEAVVFNLNIINII